MLRNLVLDVQGDFSAQLLVGGGRYAINGQFDLSGLSTNSVARPTTKGGPLIVEMQISLYNAPERLDRFRFRNEWRALDKLSFCWPRRPILSLQYHLLCHYSYLIPCRAVTPLSQIIWVISDLMEHWLMVHFSTIRSPCQL